MSAKARRSLSTWVTCDKCQTILSQKDISIHNCPPMFENGDYGFIRHGVLHGVIDIYKAQEQTKHISERELNDIVFVSQSALQLCEIAIGDPVVIVAKDNVIVKTAWPIPDKTLTSISLTKSAMELNDIEGPVKMEKLNYKVSVAKEFIISCIGKRSLPKINTELDVLLKNSGENKIFCIGNNISVPYYGKKLIYKIVQVKADENNEPLKDAESLQEAFVKLHLKTDIMENIRFYKALYSTKWTVLENTQENMDEFQKKKYKVKDIGGYDTLIANLRDMFDISLGKCQKIGDFNISKGVLLYGPPGVGKSMIANALISEYNVNSFTIYSSDIYSKSIGETEKLLKDIFTEAKSKTPSIILMEDIDTLCPKRSKSSTDHERRVLMQLVTFFDELQYKNKDILIVATTSGLDYVDASLRRPGRIDKEFEVYVPTPQMRTEILLKFLSKIPNNLSVQNILDISFVTHGFVGADIYGLCSQAITCAIKRQQKMDDITDTDTKVIIDDFNNALITTKPSAMKEILIEVPNVNWSDIGGQKDLKLKLKQAVEWPLRHPEAFLRMGITPPKGVLMFGPPGCSKTMIAKALATESKINFLNIKGPELFSKWVGESEKAVREVFRKARQVAPSIIFIDEIDALGGERSSSSNNTGSNVQERVLAQLLTELDGVTALGNVTLVAATNRPDKIDKALLRPGRLDRIIYVPLPNYETRLEIFTIKLRNMPVMKDVNVQDLVELTEGYSGAEIQAICHEAAMKALEEDLNAAIITKEHFKAALSVVTPRTPASLLKLYDDYINKVY